MSDFYPRDASTSHLAGVALKADDLIRAGFGDLEALRETRRIALDELVRRGEIEGYELLPMFSVPSQQQRARVLRLRTYSAVGS